MTWTICGGVTDLGLQPRSSMGTRGDGSHAPALRFVAGCVRCAPGAKYTCERVHARGNHSQLAPKPARNQSGLSKEESLRVAESFAGYSIRYGLDPLAPRDGSAAVRDTAGELLLDAVLVRKKFQAWVKVGTGRPQYVQCTGKGDHRGRWPTSAVHVRPRAAGATAEGTTRGRRPAPPQRAGLAPARTIPHLQWC